MVDEYQHTIWRTKEGEYIRIEDMEDDHLCSAIRYMDRKLQEYKDNAAVPPPNDQVAERNYFKLMNAEPEEYWPVYNSMVQEAKKRGLKPHKPVIVSRDPLIIDFDRRKEK